MHSRSVPIFVTLATICVVFCLACGTHGCSDHPWHQSCSNDTACNCSASEGTFPCTADDDCNNTSVYACIDSARTKCLLDAGVCEFVRSTDSKCKCYQNEVGACPLMNGVKRTGAIGLKRCMVSKSVDNSIQASWGGCVGTSVAAVPAALSGAAHASATNGGSGASP